MYKKQNEHGHGQLSYPRDAKITTRVIGPILSNAHDCLIHVIILYIKQWNTINTFQSRYIVFKCILLLNEYIFPSLGATISPKTISISQLIAILTLSTCCSFRDAGITVVNEVGVDPGIDHMLAMQVFDVIKEHGGKVR